MDMGLRGLIEEKKPVIIKKWFEAIMDTYPMDTSGFMKKQKDPFANPVGFTFSQGIEKIVTALLLGEDIATVTESLTDMIKVRAVQNFTPSQAVAFVFTLKKIIREELGGTIEDRRISETLKAFEVKIDELALSSFDIYSQCREQLNEIKVMELKNMTFGLIRQANLVKDLPAEELGNSELSVKTKRKEGVK